MHDNSYQDMDWDDIAEGILWVCSYGYDHRFPSDWNFGPEDNNPTVDARWEPTTYYYLDAHAMDIWFTQSYLCDHEALDKFTVVSEAWDAVPVYISVRRPGDTSPDFMAYEYSIDEDTVYPTS